jgi:hypothetical protein
MYLFAEQANKFGRIWDYFLYVLAERANKSGLFYLGTGREGK